jgi:hypothetical protein
MPDSKITALTALTAADPANDMIPIVDVSDTPPASGNTKRISINNILACSPSATLASATITGDLTVDTSTFRVDSTNDNVGIGTTTPASYAFNDPVKLAIANTGTAGAGNTFTIASGSTGFGQIAFANGTSGTSRYNGYIKYSHSTNAMEFYTTAGALQATLNSTGLGIGASPSYKLDVQRTADGTIGYFRRTGATINPALTVYCNETGNTVGLGTDYAGATSPAITFTTGGSERMRIDNAGNVGIFVTPSAWTSSVRAIDIVSGGLGVFSGGITNNAYFDNTDARWEYKVNGPATYYNLQTGIHQWFVAASGTANTAITTFATAAMTLDASGNLCVGATSALNNVRIFAQRGDGSVAGFNRTNSDGTNVLFYRQGLIVGDISVTTLATTYNSISDYRLKEAVQPLSGGLSRVNALKPSIYKWKLNGSNGEGFLAHELAEVVPAAVTGEKDAVNEDGSIKAQSIDMSRIVPILVAAIKELTARVQTLEAK